MNFNLIFLSLLIATLLIVSITNPTASTVFAIKGGIPNGGNSANAPSPNDQALANACANTAGKPNQPPFCVSVPPPIDSDGDGIPDESDPCPFDPTNACATDSDGDGIPDESDPCPFDPTNACATDSDGDGIPDESDPCPFDPTNACATDSDGDGIPDESDPCPFDPTNTCTPGGFTINGEGSGTVTCDPAVPGEIFIRISAGGDGTVTGSFTISHPGIGFSRTFTVTDGTTDGNTFSLSAQTDSLCTPQVFELITVSGSCGTNVGIRYEDSSAIGTFTGTVDCALV